MVPHSLHARMAVHRYARRHVRLASPRDIKRLVDQYARVFGDITDRGLASKPGRLHEPPLAQAIWR